MGKIILEQSICGTVVASCVNVGVHTVQWWLLTLSTSHERMFSHAQRVLRSPHMHKVSKYEQQVPAGHLRGKGMDFGKIKAT